MHAIKKIPVRLYWKLYLENHDFPGFPASHYAIMELRYSRDLMVRRSHDAIMELRDFRDFMMRP